MSEAHPGGCTGDVIRSEIARRATDWLCLGAAPTFAIMALLTGALGRTESHRFQMRHGLVWMTPSRQSIRPRRQRRRCRSGDAIGKLGSILPVHRCITTLRQ